MKRCTYLKKTGLILLSWCLLLSVLGGTPSAYADEAGKGQITVPQAMEDAARYIMTVDGNALTDWDAYALAKAGKPVPVSYLAAISAQLEQNGGRYSNVTDYARIALGVKAAGGNPEQIAAGKTTLNFIQSIYDNDAMTAQGTNGAIYSLLALSSGTYGIPQNAKWSADKIAAWLIQQQNEDGGWPLAAGGVSSVDITASAIGALSAYKSLPGVQQAIDEGVDWLSAVQLTNGGFSEKGIGESSESAAQVIMALSAAGVDARSTDFTKAGGNPLSYLFSYRQSDGGFAHVTGGPSGAGATGQSLMALAAYEAFTGGNSGSYEAVLSSGNGGTTGAVNAAVRVVGPDKVIADGYATAKTAYEAVTQVLKIAGIKYEETPEHFFLSVNGISGSGGTYWYYNVKRQGVWDYTNTNMLGLYDYELRSGDEIYLYYSGYDTALVKSIEVTPALPVAGQAFQVKVQQSVWNWVYNREDVTVASSVYVELGGKKVETDAQGIALFPDGLPGGTYKAEVTGYRTGTAPKIVTDSATVMIGSLPSDPAIVRIEGSSATHASGKAYFTNLLDSVQQLLTEKQVPFQIVNFSFGKYIKSVGSDADSWLYAIHRDGKWVIPMVGMADYSLQPGEEAVIYYGGFDAQYNPTTYLIDSVTLNPAQPKANESFTVTVTKTNGFDAPVPAAGVLVKVGDLTATTDSQGVATFAGLAEGTFTLDISGYAAGGAPTVVHTAQTITILPKSGGTGTGSEPVIYLTVIGDKDMGTIVSTSMALRSGDTAYSVLIRALGADRVESSGSGPTAYVRGIDGLKEFDRGPLSGWMYAVNGSYLNSGAATATLKAGDKVSWRYTLNGGTDLRSEAGATTAAATALGGTALTEAVKELGLSYDNKKPISAFGKTAVVLNADKKMSAAAAESLHKELASNKVFVEKLVFADTFATVADAKAEVQLNVPAGALKKVTGLKVSELPAEEAKRSELVSPMYEFGPAGLSFEMPVELSIKVPSAADNLDQWALVWLNEQTNEWIPIPAVIDAETGVVTGMVNHFTKFAVIDKSKLPAADRGYSAEDISQAIERASGWLKNGTELSDWSAYALSKAGAAVPDDYTSRVAAMLKEKNGTFRNVTDYERLALSVQAAGGNPESIGGFNLIERIYNNERMEVQGSNGPIYALLALNGGAYRVPAEAKWTTAKLLQWILDVQNADGSWPLVKGEAGNPDLTGAALAALSPYKERTEVANAMEKAVKWLGSVQAEDGGFALEGTENAESTAQVIWGLSVSGYDPLGGLHFKTGGKSMLAYLLGLQLENGAFPHTRGGDAEVMATEQALLALGAYKAYLNPAGPAQAAPASQPAAPAYADQADIASWALPFVQKASVYGIMEGTGGAAPAFEPKKPVTRIQFAAMLLRLLGEAPSAETKTAFADVPVDSWYAGYVAKAVAKGIASGVGEDRFAPDAAISRQEMAIMLARALKLEASGNGAGGFADLADAYPGSAAYIQAVAEKGLMEGGESGRFMPRDSATREMAAVVAVRAYELTKKP
ncbi:S-layer homology domain-containing protein [Paenibacillus hamazuiensis]|uniref:S-layer homology domain-containing protein n=1 Tax=Paenibacillus hamazuiensis TaxID=2936508 RepID=UPI0020101202|nr:S-layer homology domain-containing protein [Paenibacillus hamazuiensis]